MNDRQARIQKHTGELAHILQEWGLEWGYAANLARAIAIKAERHLHPYHNNGISPRVIIEDRYHAHGDIRIFIRSDHDREPKDILDDFLSRVPGYPAPEDWIIERREAGPHIGGTDWTCRAIRKATPKPVKRAPSPTDKQVAKAFENLDPTVAAALLAALKARGNAL